MKYEAYMQMESEEMPEYVADAEEEVVELCRLDVRSD
jgi:hypothetical protein